jgi:hypothetical protein
LGHALQRPYCGQAIGLLDRPQQNAGAKAWFADRSAQGWVADYDTIETRGFPSRFDTTINTLELADPRTGWAWSAPFFQVFALSYKPNHIIAVWPNEQTIATPLARANITAEDMRASAVFLHDTGPYARQCDFHV